jgi:hypothetical protein
VILNRSIQFKKPPQLISEMLTLKTLKRFIFLNSYSYINNQTLEISPVLEVFSSDNQILIEQVLQRDKGSLKVLDISTLYVKFTHIPSHSCINLEILSVCNVEPICPYFIQWVSSLKKLKELRTNNVALLNTRFLHPVKFFECKFFSLNLIF